MSKKENDKDTAGKKIQQEKKGSRVKLVPLPPDHPIYSGGIFIGGRITKETLTDTAKNRIDKDKN
ncbi:hypothetical protein ACFL0H_08865 [Thermodesulfobacteriota bacterium]